MRRLLAALLVCCLAAAATAAELPRADARAIRGVVAEQLEAFARDDAKRAFALATDGIRAQFGTPEAFLHMVRTAYPVVYRPKSVQFDKPETVDGVVVQPVRMTDAEGRIWIALYPMQRGPGGGWRIDGCQLSRLAATQT